jgi:hypothetical protein
VTAPGYGPPRDGTKIRTRFEHANFKFRTSAEESKQREEVSEACWSDFNTG